jgi:hypothetical protein
VSALAGAPLVGAVAGGVAATGAGAVAGEESTGADVLPATDESATGCSFLAVRADVAAARGLAESLAVDRFVSARDSTTDGAEGGVALTGVVVVVAVIAGPSERIGGRRRASSSSKRAAAFLVRA